MHAELNPAHNAGYRAYTEGRRRGSWHPVVSPNPFGSLLALEGWAWDLGWRLARFLARGD